MNVVMGVIVMLMAMLMVMMAVFVTVSRAMWGENGLGVRPS